MTHASTPHPSATACAELLRSMRAFSAFRRDLRGTTSAETRAWLPVLFALHRHPEGLRIGQLADELHVDASVASRQFARLEAAGCARRLPDPDDGRAHRLHVTDQGGEWLRGSIGSIADHLASRLEGWSDEDVADLTGGLERLTTSLDSAGSGSDTLDIASPFETSTDGVTA